MIPPPSEPPAPPPSEGAPPTSDPVTRPGAATFTIEGRQAPALFVMGWLATIVGLVAIGVSVLSGGSAGPVLLLVGLIVLAIGLIAGAGAQGIERRARGGRAYLGPSPFLVFAASVPTSIVLVVIVSVPIGLLGLAVDGPVGRLASVAVQALVYIGLLRLLVVDAGALDWAAMGVRRFDRRAVGELLSGAAWTLPVILVTIVVAGVLAAVFPVTPESPLPPAGETGGFIANLIAGAIIAPIGEELLFRGFATTAWARTIGPTRALVRAALFFAVVHVLTISGGTTEEAIGLAVIGFATRVPVALVLGWLFLRRGSIWVPIGLHATFNATLLIVAEAAARGLVTA